MRSLRLASAPTGVSEEPFFPTIIGFLAAFYGVGGAMIFGAFAYALVVFALFWLPETANAELT